MFNLGLKKLICLECYQLRWITTQSSTALFPLRRQNFDSFEHNTALYLPVGDDVFVYCFFFLFSFDIITQGLVIQLVSMDSVEPASLCMESNMEDNSGLDLICARNSLSNGLLSEINPRTLSNLGRLKIEQLIGSLRSYYGDAEDNVD